MAGEDVEVVRRFFEAAERAFEAYWESPWPVAEGLRSGDVEPNMAEAMRYLHPNVEWKSALTGVTSSGYEQTARNVDHFLEAAQDYRLRAPEVTDVGGGRALAVMQLSMQGRASDIRVDATIFAITRVRDGQVIEIDEYLERADALAAAGRAK